MSEFSIRRARPDDVETVARLVAGFRDHLRGESPSDADLRRHLPDALADPTSEFWLGCLGDEAAGYTWTRFLHSLWSGGLEAHLEDLFVLPTARGRDLGRALLRHSLERARERGAKRYSLNTNEGNAAAQSLYRSEGLKPASHALYPSGREILWVRTLS